MGEMLIAPVSGNIADNRAGYPARGDADDMRVWVLCDWHGLSGGRLCRAGDM